MQAATRLVPRLRRVRARLGYVPRKLLPAFVGLQLFALVPRG